MNARHAIGGQDGFPGTAGTRAEPLAAAPQAAPSLPFARLLVVSGIVPYPATNGYAMRTSALLEALAANGHVVDLLAFGDPAQADAASPLSSLCRYIEIVERESHGAAIEYARRLGNLPEALPYAIARFRSPAMRQRIEAMATQVDAVFCDTPYPLVNLPRKLPVPVILNTHNIEHLLVERYARCERNPVKRLYARWEGRKLRRWEGAAARRADLLLVCSEHDRRQVEEFCPGAVVVPNTIDIERYQPVSEGDGRTVLFAGGLDWHPNRDAVAFFLSKILPLVRSRFARVKFVAAGRSAPAGFRARFADIPGVRFTGTVADMREEIARAAVCVVPLRIGSGTRLKILEAAAMAKPVVATRLGAEGLAFADGEEILLADSPAEFAERVIELLRDPARCRALGLAARRRVARDYTTPVLRETLRKALGQLSETPAAPAGQAASAPVVPRPSVWRWLDRHLGRGSYHWLRPRMAADREYTQFAYARLVAGLVQPGMRWLDAGCGHRIFEQRLTQEEAAAVQRTRLALGCDASLPSLRDHRSLDKRVCCSLSQLPLADRSFDLVTLNMVAEHLEQPERVFSELARVLAPGGLLAVHTPNAASYVVRLMRLGRALLPRQLVSRLIRFLEGRGPEDVFPAFYRANSREQLSELAAAAGLAEEQLSFLLDRPLFYFLAPLSVLELLFGRLLVKLGRREFAADTILAVYRRLPESACSERAAVPELAGIARAGNAQGSRR